MNTKWLVAAYLGAITLANILTATFGPGISIVNALVLIGFDLSVRDALHSRWERRELWVRMGLLVAAGSALSWFLNRAAGRVALASLIAFALAGIVDTVVYHLMRKHPWMVRANTSNTAAAVVDSVVFPTIAFGGFILWVTLGQFAAKVIGGAVWAWILRGVRADTRHKVAA